ARPRSGTLARRARRLRCVGAGRERKRGAGRRAGRAAGAVRPQRRDAAHSCREGRRQPRSPARGRPDPRLARGPEEVAAGRRFFLKSSGLALVSFGVMPRALARAAFETDAASRKKALVVVFQRGACDGLNTVIPYAEPAYRKLRPSIALAAPSGDGKSA